MNKDYYNYYEVLFSLRKEYLKNQRIINELLSCIKISNGPLNEYNFDLVFKKNNRDNFDSLLLIVRKRQSCIKFMLDSLCDSIVYSDPDLKSGNFLYNFRLSQEYIYLLDGNQDGRYLNVKIEIDNQKEFVKLYRQLIENVICKHGRTYLVLDNEFIQLSNNGIHLLHVENDDYKNSVKLDYNGIKDNLITNNTSCLENLMELRINKDSIPNYFENIIDNNMDNYLYTIEGNNKDEGIYTIEYHGEKLVLKPYK